MSSKIYVPVSLVGLGFKMGYNNSNAKAAKFAAEHGDVFMYCNKCGGKHVARGWLALDVAEGRRGNGLYDQSCHFCREKMENWNPELDRERASDSIAVSCGVWSVNGFDKAAYDHQMEEFDRKIAETKAYNQRRLDQGFKFANMVEPVTSEWEAEQQRKKTSSKKTTPKKK